MRKSILDLIAESNPLAFILTSMVAILVVIVVLAMVVSLLTKEVNYVGCTVTSMEKTGKTAGGGKLSRTYETIRRWNCPDGDKVEVVYLPWN